MIMVYFFVRKNLSILEEISTSDLFQEKRSNNLFELIDKFMIS